MKLAEIKQMFPVGTKVTVNRQEGKPLVVNGNLGPTVLPANNVTGEQRTVAYIRGGAWVFSRGEGKGLVVTVFPKASQVLTARPGFVQFRYDNGITMTISALTS